MRNAFTWILLGTLAGCTAIDEDAPTSVSMGGKDVPAWEWTGDGWKVDYFFSDDYLAWSPKEAVYRCARWIDGPDREGRVVFRPIGRGGERFLTKKYFRTFAAPVEEVYRSRTVYVPASIQHSPGQGLGQAGPGDFPNHARREPWVEYEVLNTAHINDEGRVLVRRGEHRYYVPLWCLRVKED